jgi:hypothetical protein
MSNDPKKRKKPQERKRDRWKPKKKGHIEDGIKGGGTGGIAVYRAAGLDQYSEGDDSSLELQENPRTSTGMLWFGTRGFQSRRLCSHGHCGSRHLVTKYPALEIDYDYTYFKCRELIGSFLNTGQEECVS